MTMTSITSKHNVFTALLAALAGAFRHWRLMLLAWLTGLLAATFMARPVFGLFNSALGHNPDVGRMVSSQNIAPIIDGVMTLGDGGGSHGMMEIGQGLALSLTLAAVLTPRLTGMLVASLREGRALRFGELWAGGWREYGRQFRLLLVALIPFAVTGVIAALAGVWARHGDDTRILQSVGEQRNTIVMWIVGIVWLLAWSSVESARAAFAADPGLRSAFRAWLRGLKLMLRRPLSVLLIVIATVVVGGGLAMLLQQPAMRNAAASAGLIWGLAQLAVLALWWTRIARLSALTAISPAPSLPARPAVEMPPADAAAAPPQAPASA